MAQGGGSAKREVHSPCLSRAWDAAEQRRLHNRAKQAWKKEVDRGED